MISVCCCAINAKWDVHCFVETLFEQNKGIDFEVVLTLDNRVLDGSEELFAALSEKYPNFRVVNHSRDDTVRYLQWLMGLYEMRQRFTGDFRGYLLANLIKYMDGSLVDERKEFLWLSSGILYNRAVMAAKSDIVIVTPADFLYLFSLADLENHVRQYMKQGYFYSKPGASWCNVSNAPVDWIKKEVETAYLNNQDPSKPRMNVHNVFRDYLRYPSMPRDLYLADYRNNEVVQFTDPDFFNKMAKYLDECFANPSDQLITDCFHGVHVMTKQSWQHLGGFTEEFYGRAYADDKMTRRGDIMHRLFGMPLALPKRFSVAWIGQGEYCPSRLSYYPENHKEVYEKSDPYFGLHPQPVGVAHKQLHEGFPDKDYINHLSQNHHEKFIYEPTVRFTNGDY